MSFASGILATSLRADPIDAAVALRLVLSIEGVSCQPIGELEAMSMTDDKNDTK